MTRLESRRVLNASPLLPLHDPNSESVRVDDSGGVTIDAGRFADDGLGDLFDVRREGDRIAVSLNGYEVFSGLSSDVTSLTIQGSSDADHLRVDLGPNGVPVGTLRFDGGDQPSQDTLTLTGAATKIGHTILDAGDGAAVTTALRIDYEGVEILHDAVDAASRHIDLTEASIARLTADDDVLSLDAEGHRVTFGRSDHLTFDLDGETANRFEIDGLGRHQTTLEVAGDDHDQIVFSGRTDLDGGSLKAEAGEIDVLGRIHTRGAEIELHATSELTVGAAGLLDNDGGSIELQAGSSGRLLVAGTIDVSNDDGAGGTAWLLGHRVDLIGDARVDADGRDGGGTILVGGDYQGLNTAISNAVRTSIGRDVLLSADAIDAGDGGRIIVWSDEATYFAGTLLARGGASGDGGFAEVSGKASLSFLGTADLSAVGGRGGTLLLDPRTITVVAANPDLNGDGTEDDDLDDPGDLDDVADQGASTDSVITAGAIEALLENGQSVILAADVRIDVDAAISAATGSAGLTLIADLVSIDAGISIGGTFEVRADNIQIDSSVAITTPGSVVFSPNTAGTVIHLGGADSPGVAGVGVILGLTDAELGTITAGSLRIGSGSAGSITLADDISSPTAVLELVSGGSITTLGGPSPTGPGITASSLAVTAAGDVRLVGNNAVAELAGMNSASGDAFQFINRSGDLAISTVAGVTGIRTTAGAISLSTAGDLVIEADVVSGNQAITLSAGGSIGLGAGIEVDAGSATVTVADGTLAGSGEITGNVVVASGASISPGSGPGTLTIDGDLTLRNGSTYVFEIDDDRANPPASPIAGTDYDQIVVTGSTAIQSGAALSIVTTGSTRIDAGDAYLLIDSAGGVTGAFTSYAEGAVLEDFGGTGVDAVISYADEGAVIQVVGPVAFSAPTGDGANDLRIVRNGDLIEFYVDGVLVETSILAATESVRIVGADGEDDRLTIDYSGGVFGVEITFDGGSAGNDSLTLTGGSFETVTYTFSNANDGRIDLSGSGIDEAIVYTGLEPITDELSAVDRVFEFEGGSETISVTDAAAAGASTIDSTLGESVTFVNPTGSLTINAGSGDDVIDVTSIDAAFRSRLRIDGGAGSDEITLSAGLTLGSGAVTGHLDLIAEQITLAANIRTDGGTFGGHVTFDGAVVIASGVSIDTETPGADGSVTFRRTVDADTEVSGRSLLLAVGGGDIAFQGAVGGTTRLGTLTILSVRDIDFALPVHVLGDLTQTTGSRSTAFRGGSIGGDFDVTTATVTFASGTIDVTGSATVNATTSIRGGAADGTADLVAGSITLNVTETTGNLGIGASETPLEISTTGAVDAETSAGDGDIFLRGIGDLRIGLVDAGSGTVTLEATAAIVDALSGDGAANVNVVAGTADLSAATGIGAGDAIDTRVGILSASNGTSGAVQIDAADVLTVGGTGVSNSAGAVILRAGTNVVVNSAVRAGTDATLVATNGGVTLAADIETGAAGTARVTAGTAISQTAGRISAAGLGIVAGDDVSLLSATNTVASFAGVSTDGSLVFVEADGFSVSSVSATVDFLGATGISATAGNVTLRAAAGSLNLAADLSVSPAGTVRLSAGGGISQSTGRISAANLGAIATGAISLTSSTNDVDVLSASTSGDVSFRDADGFAVGSVAASTAFAGTSGVAGRNVTLRADSGDLSLQAAVTADASTGVIRLAAEAGAIDQTGGSITGFNLGVRGGSGGIDLSSVTNDVTVFSAEAAGSISYRDASGFTVGTTSGNSLFSATSGARSSNGDVTLYSGAGLLTLDATVSAVSTGIVRITSEGGITQTSGAVTASLLGIRAVEDVSLLGTANDVDVFAGVTTGAGSQLNYRNVDAFTIGTVAAGGSFAGATGISTNDGDVLLIAGLGGVASDGDLTISSTIVAGSGVVRINADGSVVQSAGTAITAGGLGVRATGAVILLEAANDVSTFAAATEGGVVYFHDASSLTVGGVSGFIDATLFVATSGIVTNAGGTPGADVLLVAGLGGQAGDGGIAINGTIVSGDGTVRITADGNVTQTAAITAAALGVRTTSGDIALLAINDVGVFAAQTSGGTVGFAGLNAVTIGTAVAFMDPSLFADTIGIQTAAGAITLSAGDLTVAQAISSGGGSILLQTDDLVLQAAVDATAAGLVQITPRTDGRQITLGGSGGLSLDAAEIDLITARLLAIGGVSVDAAGSGSLASAGRITISGMLTPANVQNLSFLTGADVFGASGAGITIAGAVVFDVGTGVSGLGGSDGTFLEITAAGFAGRVRSAGDFRVSSFGDVVVGVPVVVDPIAIAGVVPVGLTGIATQNGTLGIEARDGDLTVASALSVQGANADLILRAVGANRDLFLNASVSAERSVILAAGRDISQLAGPNFVSAAGVSLIAGRNIGASSAPIDLRADVVAARSLSGDVYLNETAGDGSLSVGTVDGLTGISAPGAVRVTTEEGNLAINAAVDGGVVELRSGTLGSGSATIAAAVTATGDVEITAASALTSTAAGVITGGNIDLTAANAVSLRGAVTATGDVVVFSMANAISVEGAITAGGDAALRAGGGGISLAAALRADGTADLDAETTITGSSLGSIVGNVITVDAAGLISLSGGMSSSGNTTIVSSGGGVFLAGNASAGGDFVADAGGGHITIAGAAAAAGRIDLGAGGRIIVAPSGSLTAGTIDLAAATGMELGGTVHGRGDVAVVSESGTVTVSATIMAGNLLTFTAHSGSVGVNAAGWLLGHHVGVAADGNVTLGGRVSATGDVVVAAGGQTRINGPVIAGNVVAVTGDGPISVSALVQAGGLVTLESSSNVSVLHGGAVHGTIVDITAGGAVAIQGVVQATLDTAISSGTGGVMVGALVSAGRHLALVAGSGDLFLDANVVTGGSAVLYALNGSVLQPSSAVSVAGAAVSFAAAGSVGTLGHAIDLAVGQVAVTAAGGGVWLNQTAAGGTLTVAILGSQRGIVAASTVGISTTNGDLVLAAPVKGSTVALIADRAVGSTRGRVLFDRGYIETPTGRIVAAPPGNIPVATDGTPITRFDLASPFVISFGIVAGNVANTVDGWLSDRGLSVTVDFVQPNFYDPSQSRFQTQTDSTGRLAGGQFGPFSFQYSELFLQERLIASGAREQLFDIIVNVMQDPSISIEERLAGVTVAIPTQQSVVFGNVSASPTEQSLSIPLGVVSPVVASIELPAPEPPERLTAPAAPSAYVAVPSAPPLEPEVFETSGATAGATSADRPRLFLVWRRPGVTGPPATIEIDLIWFARDYQRQLIGYLKEGRYWFELAEPGSPPRQLGDSFYVRNGLVIDDPSGEEPSAPPSSPSTETPSPVETPAIIEPRIDAIDVREADAADVSSAPLIQQSAVGLGLAVALGRPWRRRLVAARAADAQATRRAETPRMSRRVRRIAEVLASDPGTGPASVRD